MQGIRESINIHFDGENEIELSSLIATLISTEKSLKSIGRYTEQKYEIYVKPFEEGSFNVIIETISIGVAIGVGVSTVIKHYYEILKLKKELNGKPIKEVKAALDNNKMVIISEDNNSIVVDNSTINILAANSSIEDSLADMSRKLNNDTSRGDTDITFIDEKGNKEKLVLNKKDYSTLAKPIRIKDDVKKVEKTTNTVWLKVADINFTPKSDTWKFLYAGETIKATILDVDFLNQVHEHSILFGSETMLKVSLEITLIQLPNKKPKPEYKVLKILDIENGEKITPINLNI